ncbi:permease [Vibrio sp. UCD-FRSSP16_10]|uniref:sulfite exporter TauE/SafE family protein n=1 Tax=unclassified Vibrio TaxID=2614977 RepID=UPI0007FD6233|nr:MULTISPECIES: sulfite exporter TauE/SafE family protein [unclassified Vibrio]OBT13189.1 permease [Vibrio sp. UCD-FRSSP16_30]OBT19591.1 permease [Vibrio sp. UCD-FRSSP16_10]
MLLIFLGSFVQTSIGFGLAIVSAPLLFHISMDYIPAPICLVGLCISLFNALKYRTDISLGGLKLALYARVPGSVLGGMILLYVSASMLSLALGIFVLLAVMISLLPYRLEPTPNRMLVAGFLSGFMGTSSGIGGPPMALLLQHQEANSLRGNLSAFFVFSSFISLAVLFAVGRFTMLHVGLTLPLIPSAMLGYWAATRSVAYLSKQWMRRISLLLCLVSGSYAIWQGIC